MIADDVLRLLPFRTGHFALESGHHGEIWLDLELLYLRPERVQPLSSELAKRVAGHRVDAVCGAGCSPSTTASRARCAPSSQASAWRS